MMSNLRRLRSCVLHWLGVSAFWWHYPERCVMRDCRRARGQRIQTHVLGRSTPLRQSWPLMMTCGWHFPKFGAGRWET